VVLWNVLIVRLEVPDPPPGLIETLFELKVSLGPVGEHTADRDTVPANPLILARLIVTVPLLPATKVSELTFVLRLKSCTFTVIVTV